MTVEHASAAFAVVGAWWLSTALVLRLVWLRPATHRVTLGVAGALALAALPLVHVVARLESAAGSYAGFGAALALWAWHELAFLLGVVTGPRRTPCPEGASGSRRFWAATGTVIHHEVALAATLLVLVALTWGAPDQTATLTYGVLWSMRLSAKLNLFLGVPNVSVEFVPDRLRYLVTYFRRAKGNCLMPFSLLFGGAGVAFLLRDPSPGHVLAGTLLALAVIEHLFLALPIPDSLLFRWVLRDRAPLSDRRDLR